MMSHRSSDLVTDCGLAVCVKSGRFWDERFVWGDPEFSYVTGVTGFDPEGVLSWPIAQ